MEAEEGSPHRLRGAIFFPFAAGPVPVKGVLHSAVGVVALESMDAQGSVRVYPLLKSPVDCLGNMPAGAFSQVPQRSLVLAHHLHLTQIWHKSLGSRGSSSLYLLAGQASLSLNAMLLPLGTSFNTGPSHSFYYKDLCFGIIKNFSLVATLQRFHISCAKPS